MLLISIFCFGVFVGMLILAIFIDPWVSYGTLALFSIIPLILSALFMFFYQFSGRPKKE